MSSSKSKDDLSIVLNNGNRVLRGWTDIRVTRGMEQCPNVFEVGMTALDPAVATAVAAQPGDPMQVYLGRDLVITGYIDALSSSIEANGHNLRLTGRGKCQDLVDCVLEWPNAQISNNNVLQVATKLAAAYGIQVVTANNPDIGGIIPTLCMDVTEPAWDLIERICRYRALLAYEDQNGNLVLSGAGTTYAANGFEQGVNVQSANGTYRMDQRYSTYEVFLQNMDFLEDTGNGGNLAATFIDAGVKRNRKFSLAAETAGGGAGLDVAKKRAAWECVRRFGRSHQITLVTNSWRDKAGALYQPNTLAPLSLPGVMITNQDWMISSVTYLRDNQNGTTAELLLMPREGFIPEPILLQPLAPDLDQALQKIGR